MDALHAVRDEVDDLVDGVGDTRVAKGVGVVLVARHHVRELLGQRRAAQRDYAFDLLFVDHRHYARRHGDGYARDAATLQETVEELVVEEELGDQLAGACIRLFAEVEDVLGDARRFGVSFGVAGGEDVEVAALLYELDEVGGVREIAAFGHAFGEIAAQGEYVLDTRVAYARYAVLGVRPRHADAGQVHDALHPRALDLGGDRQRDFAVFGTARAPPNRGS